MQRAFDRCGGHLALDFANTLSNRDARDSDERLPGYPELVAFARVSGVIETRRERQLLARARAEPGRASAALRGALALREALYRLFSSVARGTPPAAADVAALDRELTRLHIDSSLAWTWCEDPGSLDDFLGAVVEAAAHLVTTPAARERVRICEASDCAWLFYDASRNRSRRWCDMRQCGNRMKARRHHQRGKEAGS